MKYKYLYENDIFEIETNERKWFYNDKTNRVSNNIADVIKNTQENLKQKNIFMLKILPSNLCNLSCEYCFSAKDREKKEKLKFFQIEEVLKKICDCDYEKINVSFTGGGEPTTNFELIEEVCNYIGKDKGDFNLTTNGIFDKKYIPFLKDNNFNIAISIDGNYEIQNMQQTNPMTKETYSIALENALTLTEAGNEVTVLIVLSKLVIEQYANRLDDLISDTIEFFYNKGLKSMSITFDFNVFFEKDNRLMNNVFELLKKIVVWKSFHNDSLLLVKNIFSKNDNYSNKRICRGIGKYEHNITILPNGRFSFCHRVQNPKYLTESYSKKKEQYLSIDAVSELLKRIYGIRENCKSCIARQTCMGEICPAFFIEGANEMSVFCSNNKWLKEQLLMFALNNNIE